MSTTREATAEAAFDDGAAAARRGAARVAPRKFQDFGPEWLAGYDREARKPKPVVEPRSDHTPGPWTPRQAKKPVDGQFDFAITAVINGRPFVIAETFGRCAEEVTLPAQANATLASAAPELLEALTMVRDADEDCKRDGLPTMPPAARAKIDAAIAKAGGLNLAAVMDDAARED